MIRQRLQNNDGVVSQGLVWCVTQPSGCHLIQRDRKARLVWEWTEIALTQPMISSIDINITFPRMHVCLQQLPLFHVLCSEQELRRYIAMADQDRHRFEREPGSSVG